MQALPLDVLEQRLHQLVDLAHGTLVEGGLRAVHGDLRGEHTDVKVGGCSWNDIPRSLT